MGRLMVCPCDKSAEEDGCTVFQHRDQQAGIRIPLPDTAFQMIMAALGLQSGSSRLILAKLRFPRFPGPVYLQGG